MKNKYFILVFTFLCLLVVQSSYSQDWQDMGWDDATNDFVQDFVDQGGTVDYFNDAQDYAEAVNNDYDSSNDWEYGSYIDSDLVGTTIEKSDGTIYDYKYTEGWFPVNHSSNGTTIDIFDGLLDTHNYDNGTGTTDDDQYPPDDDNNDDTPTNDPPAPDTPATRRAWYLDNDGDGYYAYYVWAIDKPIGNYKETGEGFDCDDNNRLKNLGTDCGWKKWYLDEDGDQYHSDETEQADSPGTGWVLATKGVDCEESDPTITDQCRRKTWYFDWDGDQYHSNEMMSGDYPGAGWVLTTKGIDCDDIAPTITTQCRPSTCKGCPEVTTPVAVVDFVLPAQTADYGYIDPQGGVHIKSEDVSI